MSKLEIQGNEYMYDESEIIDFAEGLIGLPEMRRAVLVPLPEYAPFCWLTSIDDELKRFIVVNPEEIYADYKPSLPNGIAGKDLKTLAIVKISSDWRKTTVNLRAPIFINSDTKRGSQCVLTDSRYQLAETLPQN